MRKLLYNIEWPSVRRLRIGILCTYWYFVRALPYSVIESTQSPWDSGSRIDNMHEKQLLQKLQFQTEVDQEMVAMNDNYWKNHYAITAVIA